MSVQLSELATFLEEQMGLVTGWLLAVPTSVFLYISASKQRILGCIITQDIQEACRAVYCIPGQRGQLLSCSSAAKPSNNVSADNAGNGSSGMEAEDHADVSVTNAASSFHAASPPSISRSKAGHKLSGRVKPAKHAVLESSLPQAVRGGCSFAIDRSCHIKALCGVRMMWTAVEARRQGIASKLLDLARAHAVRGYVVPRRELAFTQPTPDGQAFIQRYTGTPYVLVY